MKDKLKKFILENREQFDIYKPAPRLWEKINISIKKPGTKKINWKGIIWKAAAVVIIFVSSFLLHEYLHLNNIQITRKLIKQRNDQVIPELLEAEIYYSNLIKNKLAEVQPHLLKYPDLGNELNFDLSELDSIYYDLRNDLKDNIANQEVVEAMIQNYRLKLKILEDLLEQLQNFNNSNNNKENQHDI